MDVTYFSGVGSSGSSRRMTWTRRPLHPTGTYTIAELRFFVPLATLLMVSNPLMRYSDTRITCILYRKVFKVIRLILPVSNTGVEVMTFPIRGQ